MSTFSQQVTSIRDKAWAWFTRHAQSKHALAWLAFIAFTDAILSPLAPEVFLVALMLAHPTRWKAYLPVAIVSSTAGAAVGYWVALFLFHQFGEPILHFYGLQRAFVTARHLLGAHVFLAMSLASFTPIPDKVFIYASGFLGVRFFPFLSGFFLGRGIRMALITYLTGRFGKHILDLIDRYLLWAGSILLALVAYYGIVHFHVFGL